MQRLIVKALAGILAIGLITAATAGAASLITGADIQNGSVTGKDIKKGGVKLSDLSGKAKASLAGVPGPGGPAGPAGAQGPVGPEGAPGSADRYAEVRDTGLLSDDVHKNVTDDMISHDADTGVYCLTFPAESLPLAGAANAVLSDDVIVSLQIETGGGMSDCPPAATVKVITFDVSAGARADRAFRLMLEDD
jgi:hypothetical protein